MTHQSPIRMKMNDGSFFHLSLPTRAACCIRRCCTRNPSLIPLIQNSFTDIIRKRVLCISASRIKKRIRWQNFRFDRKKIRVDFRNPRICGFSTVDQESRGIWIILHGIEHKSVIADDHIGIDPNDPIITRKPSLSCSIA